MKKSKNILVMLVLISLTFGFLPVKSILGAPSLSVYPSTSISIHVKNAAVYRINVTNNCTEDDIFNVTYSQNDPDWSVEFFKSDNSTALSDTNNDGIIDTDLINSNSSTNIYVHITPKSSVCHNTSYTITVTLISTNTNCGGSSSIDLTTTAINSGNLVITKESNISEGKIGDTVTWTIHIENTGSDPIGNVVILDTLGGGLSSATDVNFNPNPDSGSFPSWSYDEIPAGSKYEVTFKTTISGCSNAHNEVNGTWGNNCQSVHALQSVKIIPTVPNISYTPPSIAVPYCGSTNVDIPITNNGNGFAKDFKIKIETFPSEYQISNVAGDWNFNTSTGEFVYTGGSPSGRIDPGETIHLTFTVSVNYGTCNVPSTTLKYYSYYKDPCDNDFINPTQIGSISYSSDAPYLTINKTGPDPVDIGDTNLTYTVSITYHKGSCPQNSIVVDVVDNLPAPFIPQSASNGGSINGQEVKWDNLTLEDSVTYNFTITFNVTDDPCYAGQEYTNTVNVLDSNGGSITDCCGCSIANSSASFSTYVNDPARAIIDSAKSVNLSSIEIDCSTTVDTNNNNRRYTVEYQFNTGTSAPSNWNNTDNNGGILYLKMR